MQEKNEIVWVEGLVDKQTCTRCPMLEKTRPHQPTVAFCDQGKFLRSTPTERADSVLQISPTDPIDTAHQECPGTVSTDVASRRVFRNILCRRLLICCVVPLHGVVETTVSKRPLPCLSFNIGGGSVDWRRGYRREEQQGSSLLVCCNHTGCFIR